MWVLVVGGSGLCLVSVGEGGEEGGLWVLDVGII